MKRMLWIISAILVCAPLCPLTAQARDIPTVLIIPFDNATGNSTWDAWEKGFPDMLTAFLSPYDNKIRVVDRTALEAYFAEQSLHWEGFTEQKSYSVLGQLSQARYIVRGSISGKQNALAINVMVYETETTRLLKSFESAGRSENITQATQRLAAKIAEFFQTDIKPMADLPLEEDPDKSVNLIYGLGYFHNGQFEQALVYFMKILEDDPEDELASYWLAKTFLSAGMKDHAVLETEKFLQKFPESPRKLEIQAQGHTFNNKEGLKDEQ